MWDRGFYELLHSITVHPGFEDEHKSVLHLLVPYYKNNATIIMLAFTQVFTYAYINLLGIDRVVK